MIDARVMHLREIAVKGGAATKAKMLGDPEYYQRIGRLGGSPSHANPRKARKPKRRKRAPKPPSPPMVVAPVVAEEKPMTPLRRAAIEREANRKAREQRLAAVAAIEA